MEEDKSEILYDRVGTTGELARKELRILMSADAQISCPSSHFSRVVRRGRAFVTACNVVQVHMHASNEFLRVVVIADICTVTETSADRQSSPRGLFTLFLRTLIRQILLTAPNYHNTSATHTHTHTHTH